ncbi:MAG: hypothetical protein E7813_04230 [Bradyrhizobium sp.]|uniref:hypothetical protein n=1 Tax=Bradyrhizobium sp. TaxID=376 RepID=UPI00121A32EE|nr:hypothetical protein [Bradyrhizobium sp.]THD72479.1 MAG: hypothetical protein E7813_04230 [Bradyrhizobium sp.]
MASILEKLKQLALDYASNRQREIADIDKKLAQIEQEKLNLSAEREKAHATTERATNFPIEGGTDYPCPICWADGITSFLRPVSSPDSRDMFRCNKCHFEDAF